MDEDHDDDGSNTEASDVTHVKSVVAIVLSSDVWMKHFSFQ